MFWYKSLQNALQKELVTFVNSSLSSNQDTNQFFGVVGIEPQISYSTIRNFIS